MKCPLSKQFTYDNGEHRTKWNKILRLWSVQYPNNSHMTMVNIEPNEIKSKYHANLV